jgi:hypothetical protein
MAADKIFELGTSLSLSGQHLNLYFENRQWPQRCVLLQDRAVSNLSEWLPFVADEAMALRLPVEKSDEVLRQFPRLPADVSWLATTDILYFEKNQCWPRLQTFDTIKGVLVHRFNDVDTSLCAYIVGATHKGRAAAAALASMGFTHLRFIDNRPELMNEELQLLRRYLFGVEISSVDAESLTLETIPGSLMLNTLPMQDHGTVLKDLSYFNFMKRGGVVVDTADCNQRNAFLDEAESAGLRILSGIEYQAQSDVDLLHRLMPGQYVTYEDYLESFTDSLDVLKNPPSV